MVPAFETAADQPERGRGQLDATTAVLAQPPQDLLSNWSTHARATAGCMWPPSADGC